MSSLKVLSYNICEGGDGRLVGIADVIRNELPNAVALLEATNRDNAAALASELGMELAFGEANNGVHIAWLSRLSIRRSTNYRLAALAKTLLEIEVDWEGLPLQLFATHLASRHDASVPADEVTAILDVLHPFAGRLHLLMGDLNALRPDDPVGTPPHGVVKRGDAIDDAPRLAIRRLLEAGYVDCYRAMHPQLPGYTYPSDAPWLRLDYVFASPEMATRVSVCDIVVGDAARRASDHLPVGAAFR